MLYSYLLPFQQRITGIQGSGITSALHLKTLLRARLLYRLLPNTATKDCAAVALLRNFCSRYRQKIILHTYINTWKSFNSKKILLSLLIFSPFGFSVSIFKLWISISNLLVYIAIAKINKIIKIKRKNNIIALFALISFFPFFIFLNFFLLQYLQIALLVVLLLYFF